MFHLHGKGIKDASKKNAIQKIIYRKVFKNSRVICLTNKLTEDIQNVSLAKPFIVPYGIPVQQDALNTDIRRNNNNTQILYLSNYKETKGVLMLIDALSILKEQEYSFSARLVGGPSDLSIEDLKKYVADKKLEKNIDVVGTLYDEKKYSEFKAADIFVFPTYYANETFGIVNLEAMQFGLPIITTDEGGISEVVINDKTGFVIQPKNLQQLVEKLSILLNNKNLREEMGTKGKEVFFNQYTLMHFEQNLKYVFETIIN